MGTLDPIADTETREQSSLSPRIDGFDGKRIGLLSNAKQTAKPLLMTVKSVIEEEYDNVSFDFYEVDALDDLKDKEVQSDIQEWAQSLDAGITAMGDCGSCTKYLVWGTDSIEKAGTPGVGLLTDGFVLDWKSNSADRGRKIRYKVVPIRSEVSDRQRIEDKIDLSTIEDIESEHTRPLTDEEEGK